MTGSIFWRLTWKELRLQRAFWIAMLVLTVLLQWVVVGMTPAGPPRTNWLFEVALVLAALYAVGCGATLFATEHETGTYEFQRALPVSAGRLFFNKLAFAVAATSAMIGTVWVLAAIFAGGNLPERDIHPCLWATWGFGAVELLVWGVFFSLLLSRPLKAAVLAMVAAGVSVHFVVGLQGPQYRLGPYLAALPYRAALAAVVASVTIWLGHRWFCERVFWWPRMRRSRPAREVAAQRAGAIRPLSRPSQGFSHLLWQQLRQSAGMLGALGAMVAPLFLLWLGLAVYGIFWGRSVAVERESWLVAAMVTACAAAPLAGACVFLGDQRRRGYRFLAERGARPSYVWLSRHLVWITAALVWTIVVLRPLCLGLRPQVASDPVLLGGMVLTFMMLAYTAGQLCSMVFASGVLAGFFGVALTGLLCAWSLLMMELDVPWLWSVAPIPLVLLLATWLRTPHWLLERNTLKGWLPTVLCLALSGIVIVTSVCAYRVYSVPAVDCGFNPKEFAQPAASEARATANVYRRALEACVRLPSALPGGSPQTTSPESGKALTEAEVTWLEENAETLRLALAATQRPACDFYDPICRTSSGRPGIGFGALGHLLVVSARRFESEGKLDAALDRYLATLRFTRHLRHRTGVPQIADGVERLAYQCLARWAAHPDQTAERIRAAIARVEPLQKGLPSPSDAIKSDYILVRQIISGDPAAAAEAMDLSAWDPLVLLATQRLPWEEARADRVLSLLTARNLQLVGDIESAVLRNQELTLPEDGEKDWHWQRFRATTPLFLMLRYGRGGFHAFEWDRGYHLAADFVRMETRRRAVIVQLALAGWAAEHGALPERLEELVGPFLKHLPLDPYAANLFEYFPQGTSVPVLDRDPRTEDLLPSVIVPAGKPYFQSAGRRRRFKQHRHVATDREFVFEIRLPQ